jgi:hypothetical protein
MIAFLTALSAAGAVASAVFDTIVIRWHLQERKRFAVDEQRLTDDEEKWASPQVFSVTAGQAGMADDGWHRPFGFTLPVTARK